MDEEHSKKMSDWLKGFIFLGPIFITIWLSMEIDNLFKKSDSSSFVYIILQTIVLTLGLVITFINAIYIDKSKDGIRYEEVLRDHIVGVLYFIPIPMGIGILQWVAS